MASEQGPIATEAHIASLAAPQAPKLPQSVVPANASSNPAAPVASTGGAGADIARAHSLKRPRESTPTATAGAPGAQHSPDVLPAKFAKLIGATRHPAAPPLTGQAALDDEQRRREEEARLHPADAVSENPAQAALSALRAQAAMSRADNAPLAAPLTLTDLTVKPAVPELLTANGGAAADAHSTGETSPQSATSRQTLGSGGHVTHSPAPMEGEQGAQGAQEEAPMGLDHRLGTLSYPGMMNTSGTMQAPPRGMSLPTAGQDTDTDPSSPSSNRKHKCPFCDTVFTRHHNLKSHLLTHSQEKPYVCQDCNQRFRRLHDLKRHSKLHTGEKPHICPKCDRKFARGDALARHSKGAGGCAGRRPSMGSFGADDDYDASNANEADDSAMAGVMYDSTAALTEEEQRRLSLPVITSEHVRAGQPGSEGFGAHSRTYPPPGVRTGAAGGLFPPAVQHVPPSHTSTSPSLPSSFGGGHTPSTSISSLPVSTGGNSLYSLGMTESPKPLSPSGLQPRQAGQDAPKHRQRSPSLTAQLQQQLASRRLSNVPAPQTGIATSGAASTGLAPATGPQQHDLTHSRNSSGPSHGHASVDSSTNLFSSEQGLWAYIQTLEERMKLRDEHVKLLEEQVRSQTARIEQLELHSKSSFDARIAVLSQEVDALRSAHPPSQTQGQQEPAPMAS